MWKKILFLRHFYDYSVVKIIFKVFRYSCAHLIRKKNMKNFGVFVTRIKWRKQGPQDPEMRGGRSRLFFVHITRCRGPMKRFAGGGPRF